jgi:hypothetical protein
MTETITKWPRKEGLKKLHYSSLQYIRKTSCNQRTEQVKSRWIMKTQDEENKIKIKNSTKKS